MAKRVNSISFKGVLDSQKRLVVETVKDVTIAYSLQSIMDEFHGKSISLVIKEQSDMEGDD